MVHVEKFTMIFQFFPIQIEIRGRIMITRLNDSQTIHSSCHLESLQKITPSDFHFHIVASQNDRLKIGTRINREKTIE
jgi:hypothetical protein